MKLSVFTFFIFYSVLGQTEETVKIYQEGDKAFQSQDYEKAKSIFASLTKIDAANKKPWFNLGVVELTLGNIEAGCSCIKRAHNLQHNETGKILTDYCSEYYIHFDQLDIKPKFIHKDKNHDLFSQKNRLNPKFEELLVKKIQSSPLMDALIPGSRMFIQIALTKKGPEFKVARMPVPQHKVEEANEMIDDIFESFEYEPAKHRGKSVEVIETWMFPLMVESPPRPIRDFVPYRNGD